MSEDRKKNKLDPARVKVGDIMSFTYYVQVQRVQENGEALLTRHLDGHQQEITFRGGDLIREAGSADQYSEEVKVSRTAVIDVLAESHSRPLTVSFFKADGSHRVMRCRLLNISRTGHANVEDLEKVSPKDRFRQVDLRTLQWLVVDGVKYTVK